MPFKPLSCIFGNFYIAQRYIMVFMVHLAILNAYHLRAVVNIAMAEMKGPTNHSRKVDACPMYEDEYIEKMEARRHEWSNQEESWILGGFYFGYLFSHVPGGWLADVIGARHVLGFCLMSSSFVTFFYPLCIETESIALAVFMRVLVGLFQGPIFPCLATFIQSWVPSNERSFLGGIVYCGSTLGTITGNILTGYMIRWTNNWKTPFYIWPLCALVWYAFYLFMVFSRPETHPFITKEELEYLQKEVPKKMKIKVPWKAILKSPTTWALIAGQFGHDYLFFTILADLPKYMKDILKMNITKNAVYSSIPFFFMWLSSILSGYIAQLVVNRSLLTVLTVRRTWTAFAALIPAIFLLLVVYIGCNRTVAVILYNMVMFLHGPYFAGQKVNINDVTSYYGGSLMAIVNGFGAIAGIAGPGVIGLITENHSLQEWQWVMWIMFGVMFVTTVIYCTITKVERESWDFPEELQ